MNGGPLHADEIPYVRRCTGGDSLAAAADLVKDYRRHYDATGDGERTHDWLSGMVEAGMLSVFTVSPGQGVRPVGFATVHPVPASLSMGLFWQLRDLFVLPPFRRQGLAAALVTTVRDEAMADGASRLSLMTEQDNDAALGLYQRFGFRRVEGLTALSMDLSPGPEAGAEPHDPGAR